jgi:hypothetical protein
MPTEYIMRGDLKGTEEIEAVQIFLKMLLWWLGVELQVIALCKCTIQAHFAKLGSIIYRMMYEILMS